uniref:Uncharacterized protein n=1 Tax=Picea glauca TaxID=3330 RepID=A0A101LYN9_PICGL|nr:hypothetical protein ABT39_MTgene4765 [Picea glauca]
MAMNLTLEPKGMLREVLHHIPHRSNALGPGGFYLDSTVSPTSAPTIASISAGLCTDKREPGPRSTGVGSQS